MILQTKKKAFLKSFAFIKVHLINGLKQTISGLKLYVCVFCLFLCGSKGPTITIVNVLKMLWNKNEKAKIV